MGLVVMTCVVLGGFSASAMAAPSDLDSTFGSGGKAVVDFGGSEVAFASARQPDGKLLVAGETSAGATPDNFAVARLKPDGSLDAAFGVGGKTTVDFGGDDNARTAVLQSDGKIILAGDSTSGTGGHNFAAARLNPDGTVDSSFGAGGKVTIDFGGDDGASAVVAQPDGKVVLAGDTTNGPGAGDLAVARLDAAGSLDASFGIGGKTTIDFGGQEIGRAAAAQSGGAIIVAGGTTAGAGGEDFAIARLSSAGLLDNTFGSGGKTTVDFGGDDDTARAVALQPDGKIVVAGTGAGADFVVARLTGGTAGGGGGGGGAGGTTAPAPIAALPWRFGAGARPRSVELREGVRRRRWPVAAGRGCARLPVCRWRVECGAGCAWGLGAAGAAERAATRRGVPRG